MPASTPDQPGTDSAPAAVPPPVSRRVWLDPTTLRGALFIGTVAGLAVWVLTQLPQHLSVHWR